MSMELKGSKGLKGDLGPGRKENIVLGIMPTGIVVFLLLMSSSSLEHSQ